MQKLLLWLLFSLAALLLPAREYDLSPGEDACERISALQPGDTLRIRIGVHPALTGPISVKGTPEQPIVICGEDPDLSIFSAWSTNFLPQWTAVPGERFAFATPCPETVVSVTDVTHDLQLQPAPGLAGLSGLRGTYYYDPEAQQLYVHSADGRQPGSGLRIGTHSGHLIILQAAENIILRDLSFTGSSHREAKLSALGSAIRTLNTRHLRIENCSFYFNTGGVNITNHCYDSIVRKCFFRQNNSYGYSEMAQLFFGSYCQKNQAIDNIIMDGRTHGLRFYSGAEDCTATGNIIVNEMIGLYYKASKGERRAERNIVLGCQAFNFSDLNLPISNIHNTLQKPSFLQDDNPTNLLFSPEEKDTPRWVAPEYLDFRLQEGSPGSGRGAYPEPAAVLYAATTAEDYNLGTRMDQPLPGLSRALNTAPEHSTIYLLEGTYASATVSKPVTLRGMGKVIIPELTITSDQVNLAGLEVNRLQARAVQALNCQQLQVETATISNSKTVSIKHCQFQQLDWRDNHSSRILFSVLPAREYAGARCGGNSRQPGTLMPGHALAAGLKPAPHPAVQPQLEGPALSALYPSLVTISWITPNIGSDSWRERDNWWTPRPVLSLLEYGTTPECTQQIPSLGEIFHSVSLQDLQPDTKYYYRVRIPAQPLLLNVHGALQPAPVSPWAGNKLSETFSFTTPADRPAESGRTYHLQPGELNRYSALARPGDTLILSPGVYRETFRPPVSGLPGAPITLKAAETGQVILDGAGHLIPAGVYLDLTDHIIIDGIIFRHFANKLFSNRQGMEYGQIQILRSRQIDINNCVFLGHGAYQFFINMKWSGDIRIRNNVFFTGVNGLGGDKIGNLLVEQNTFYDTSIRNFMLNSFRPGSRVSIRQNLFLGQIGSKARFGTTMGELNEDGLTELQFDHNIWFFSPDNQIRFCGFERNSNLPTDADGPRGLERLRQKRGWEQNGQEISTFQFANGRFIDPWDDKRCQQEFSLPIARAEFVPALDFFDPEPGLIPEHIGAHSRRP
ncbi:MAG: hypothetical protein GX564_13940 [Oligosphaeraceae bacterium]|nr:hypothetical protein [Oligosphaeraceae bacterium]